MKNNAQLLRKWVRDGVEWVTGNCKGFLLIHSGFLLLKKILSVLETSLEARFTKAHQNLIMDVELRHKLLGYTVNLALRWSCADDWATPAPAYRTAQHTDPIATFTSWPSTNYTVFLSGKEKQGIDSRWCFSCPCRQTSANADIFALTEAKNLLLSFFPPLSLSQEEGKRNWRGRKAISCLVETVLSLMTSGGRFSLLMTQGGASSLRDSTLVTAANTQLLQLAWCRRKRFHLSGK